MFLEDASGRREELGKMAKLKWLLALLRYKELYDREMGTLNKAATKIQSHWKRVMVRNRVADPSHPWGERSLGSFKKRPHD